MRHARVRSWLSMPFAGVFFACSDTAVRPRMMLMDRLAARRALAVARAKAF